MFGTGVRDEKRLTSHCNELAITKNTGRIPPIAKDAMSGATLGIPFWIKVASRRRLAMILGVVLGDSCFYDFLQERGG